ncbi:M48 family metallopeptidase [Nitrospirillum viridazoti]|uniref:Zn-dependent protease with chaperone function n=2 Tax=Nitrospirillum TaxID=1543705 RepID=A0A560HPX9_9PROT|nr:M48 family metallopeptidase [Nitrospirillum amazonense]TWB48628.1 Zn-dependent protease with chaperone function [Nitrospirillum amazonense]
MTAEASHATWTGRLYRAGLSRAEIVTVRAGPQGLVLSGTDGDEARTVPRHTLTIVPPVGGDYWRFDCANGDTLEVIGGGPLAAALGHKPGLLSRLEGSWRLALASVPVLLGLGAATWYWGVPEAADLAAAHTPPWVERKLTDAGLGLIFQDEKERTTVDPARQKRLAGILADMVGAQDGEAYHLHFLNSPLIGPNAFALPGGDIIVTDQLLKILDDEEVAAVLAHEVGHVRHRHGLRLALRASGLSVLAAVAVGDASTAGHFLVGAPVLLLNLRFTREFEAEADADALAWLSRDPGPDGHPRSPCAFARALRKIVDSPEVKQAAAIAGHIPSWLTTHPMTEERLRPFDAACPAKI